MQKLHPPLELDALRPGLGELGVELGRARLQLVLRIDAEFAVIGMEAEIGEEQRRDAPE